MSHTDDTKKDESSEKFQQGVELGQKDAEHGE